MAEPSAILESVRRKGVELWSKQGVLHYKAPKGALTGQEIDRLRAASIEIVSLLEEAGDAPATSSCRERRPRLQRAPLAYAQLAHWHLYQLRDQPAIRHIASATRLRGPLNIGAMEVSLLEMLDRHDALRTRIEIIDGVPMQDIRARRVRKLMVEDLSWLPDNSRENEMRRLIEELILEPIRVSVGPLLGLRLLKLRSDEHVLILAMEHMISDMYSMALVLNEMFTVYAHVLAGRAVSLPVVRMQFSDYAAQQRNAQPAWIEKHQAYWESRLGGGQRLRFPEDSHAERGSLTGWGTAPIRIEASLKLRLRDWCRTKRTTLAMGMFVAYVGFVLRRCDVSEGIIQFAIDGRSDPSIKNSVGFFASTLFLRVQLFEDDNFEDLLNRVVAEYCAAHEHADFYYMATQVPRPDFTRTTMFNYVPHGSKIEPECLSQACAGLTCSPVPFASPALTQPMLKNLALDYEPMMLLHEADAEILGGVHFPSNRFSLDTMARFASDFVAFTTLLLTLSERPLKDLVLA